MEPLVRGQRPNNMGKDIVRQTTMACVFVALCCVMGVYREQLIESCEVVGKHALLFVTSVAMFFGSFISESGILVLIKQPDFWHGLGLASEEMQPSWISQMLYAGERFAKAFDAAEKAS